MNVIVNHLNCLSAQID